MIALLWYNTIILGYYGVIRYGNETENDNENENIREKEKNIMKNKFKIEEFNQKQV